MATRATRESIFGQSCPSNILAGIIVLGGAVDPVMSEAWGQTEIGEAAERVTTLLYMQTCIQTPS